MRRSAYMLALLLPLILTLPLTVSAKEDQKDQVPDLASVSDTKQLCSDAVSLMAQGEVIAAFDHVRAYWPRPDQEQDRLATLTDEQMQALAKKYGAPLGYEYLGTKKGGDRFVEHQFLQRYPQYAIRLVCIFYRGDKNWQLNTIYGDDQVSKMF